QHHGRIAAGDGHRQVGAGGYLQEAASEGLQVDADSGLAEVDVRSGNRRRDRGPRYRQLETDRRIGGYRGGALRLGMEGGAVDRGRAPGCSLSCRWRYWNSRLAR